MEQDRESGEKMREAACIGDEETLRSLIMKGVDVNCQSNMNGWTSLHWAAKRGHKTTVTLLLSHGANPNLANNSGDAPGDLAADLEIRSILGGKLNGEEPGKEAYAFAPNYLANPQFPYVNSQDGVMASAGSNVQEKYQVAPPIPQQKAEIHPEELVLKARVANSAERDFIEVDIDRRRLSFENLVSLLCSELKVNRTLVQKIRKLPDTIIRKDKDVRRLHDYQEVEVVLCNKAVSESSRNYGTSVAPIHVDVVY